MSQIETIFYKIQDIFEIHKEFYDALLPNIQQWDEKVTVGHLFQKLVSVTLQRVVFSLVYRVHVNTLTLLYSVNHPSKFNCVRNCL